MTMLVVFCDWLTVIIQPAGSGPVPASTTTCTGTAPVKALRAMPGAQIQNARRDAPGV